MDVDVAVFAGFVVIFLSVEPEDACEDEVLLLHWVGGFPDTTGGFPSNKVGSGFGVVPDFLADPMPAKGGLVAVGLGTRAFFCSGDRERAGDRAVVGNDVETLVRDGDAKVHRVRLR